MKEVFLVLCWMEREVDGKYIMAATNEGDFDNMQDAEDRRWHIAQAEGKQKQPLYIEIKPVVKVG